VGSSFFARDAGTQVWAWCLMPNHVHFVAVPPRAPLAWPWSSAGAYLARAAGGLTATGPMLSRFPVFAAYLVGQSARADAVASLRKAEQAGRPLGAPGSIAALEAATARPLARRKPGPRPSDIGEK
jgi:hypothetical protein